MSGGTKFQETLLDARSSRAARYRDLVVGEEAGWGGLLHYEIVTALAGNAPGALGLALRSVFYPGLFGRFGRGAGLSQTQMRWIWETYLERPDQQHDWRAAPLLADLAGLPPAHLIVGSLDPLLDDSHNLAAALKKAGVPCTLTVYEGINHGFIRYGRLIGTARRAIADCAAALKAGLAH